MKINNKSKKINENKIKDSNDNYKTNNNNDDMIITIITKIATNNNQNSNK